MRVGLSFIVANGDRLPCRGVCAALAISVATKPSVINYFSLALASYDIILGTEWLRSLGLITWDFTSLSMTCCLQGHWVTWIGEPGRAPVACRQLQVGEMMEYLLTEFEDLFTEPTGLPPTRVHDHRIHLETDAQPVAVRPYQYLQLQKDELELQCEEMLRQGLIRLSTSAFLSPVLHVKKHDGLWRFCIDYRAPNAITIKDKFPIPVVEELLDELFDAKCFTKLDLRSGYHQVRMFADDVGKTVFHTHHGHYEFLVMPFGLTNASVTFQVLMNDILRRYLHKYVLVFFDDILIYSASWADHLRHVRLILDTLCQH